MEVVLAVEHPAVLALREMSENQHSTRFSHDACVGVKWKRKRGWARSQSLTSGVEPQWTPSIRPVMDTSDPASSLPAQTHLNTGQHEAFTPSWKSRAGRFWGVHNWPDWGVPRGWSGRRRCRARNAPRHPCSAMRIAQAVRRTRPGSSPPIWYSCSGNLCKPEWPATLNLGCVPGPHGRGHNTVARSPMD